MKPAAPVATVDAQNPWLGLVSFTEETRGYFHGRDEEVAELGRRVQRKLLTVLFGQSGLGKTSILQAGLVPRLRPEGYCPVYVRIDYDPSSPSPSEQIKQAVFRSTESAGSWTQSGSAVVGETLWEFLHHRDDVLKDASGRPLIPILIFDQFEEIFTLAQSDDAGRRRAHEFLADLADLVENRPPAALEARIDRDEADAARFDFARADYRILISLREDYLAHLEGLKGQMPSVTQNRMRLARMTGAQAVAAVRAPAPDLVGEAVAEAIVRFVAGGADLAHAEVEPSLLSLICRELNNARLSAGHAEISADLLAGSRDTILSEFYERALADQPPGVRIFIEDEMLTDSGFRESIAEERVVKGFAAAGAGPGALAALVDRRLLRVEDRLDLRRVEITHDVLCGVIGASRGVRHEREALEESKRQLAEQKAREAATHRSLVRARAIAAVALALMLVAAGSAVFGWINLRRAREAEVQIVAARLLAEEARGQSEKLVGFLLEDFYEELEPTGRVEIVGKLADKAAAYYEALPPELVTTETRRYQGMALVRKAIVLGESGNYAEATTAANEAIRMFERLRTGGDRGEDTTLGLALAYYARCIGIARMNKEDLTASANLLRPLVASGHASRSTKLALAESLNLLGLTLGAEDGGVAPLMESRAILEGLGAVDLSDLTAASRYGDVTDTQCRLELDLGNLKEAGRLAQIVGETTEKVLARRPGDLQAMKNRFYSADDLAQVDDLKEDLAGSEAAYRKAIDVSQSYALFNPADNQGWQYWISSINNLGLTLMEEGRVKEGLEAFRRAAGMERDPRNHTGITAGVLYGWRYDSMVEGQLGHVQAAKDALSELGRVNVLLIKQLNADEILRKSSILAEDLYPFEYLASQGNFESIHSQALALRNEVASVASNSSLATSILLSIERASRNWLIESDLQLGLYKDAEALAREAIDKPLFGKTTRINSADLLSRSKLLLGRALVGQDRKAEALIPLGEAEAHYRSRLANGATDTYFRQDFAGTLYQLARAQAEDDAGRIRRRALLDEAAAVLDGSTAEAKQLRLTKELIEWVAQARAFSGG